MLLLLLLLLMMRLKLLKVKLKVKVGGPVSKFVAAGNLRDVAVVGA